MTRLNAQLLCGVIAFAASIISGYALKTILSPQRLASRFPESRAPFRRRFALAANLPMFLGYGFGVIALLLLQRFILPGDRFYPPAEALRIALVPIAAGFAFLVLDVVWPPTVFLGRKKLSDPAHPNFAIRTAAMLILLIALSAAGALLGIRFPLLAVPSMQVVELGETSMIVASMAWLLIATLMVKLLDGLDGAAPMLLLLWAAVVWYTTSSTMEYFLGTYAMIMMGLVIGSLRFHIYPALMPLRGGGSAFAGYLFAVLTVLARQKSVTAGLIAVPIILLVVVIGGMMLGFLERTLTLRRSETK